jgi:crotonobetainyl-CoA:carnitine CoA-transferase CaiB-like acyl-CoA transferase
MNAALGHAEWSSDARFASNPLRVRHAAELYALIEPVMLTRTAADWTLALEAVGVPCAPVQDVQQMVTHPQTQALGILQDVPGCSVPLIGLPISFDGRRPQPRSAAPALGADTAHVFRAAEDAGAAAAQPTQELMK